MNSGPRTGPTAFIDLTAKRFGRLLVIERAPGLGKNKVTSWFCICDCGNTITTLSESLRSGATRSCGCLVAEMMSSGARKTHGMSGTKIHRTWKALMNRCRNPNSRDYEKYHRLGMAPEFLKFEAFYEHIGDPPDPSMSIDRIDNTKGYFPGNIRWATQTQQARNTSQNRILTMHGETKCLAEWSEQLDIPYNLIRTRLANGWSVEKALSTPHRLKPGIVGNPNSKYNRDKQKALARVAARSAIAASDW